jgi:hypothetical protein
MSLKALDQFFTENLFASYLIADPLGPGSLDRFTKLQMNSKTDGFRSPTSSMTSKCIEEVLERNSL